MGTVRFECGCYISSSMFPPYDVMHIGHCPKHYFLFSGDKSLNQMAKELRDYIKEEE